MLGRPVSSREISIHALREEGDSAAASQFLRWHGFLSTPSARRATACPSTSTALCEDFYPRPPRGGRLRAHQHLRLYVRISIHALREEGDGVWIFDGLKCTLFLSTPSARRATITDFPNINILLISIHALREEGDAVAVSRQLLTEHFYPRPPRGGRLRRVWVIGWLARYFYPRPPRGGRRATSGKEPGLLQFLSTPSARRATLQPAAPGTCLCISIHALREEGDGGVAAVFRSFAYFYPRPPRGGRRPPSTRTLTS